MTSICILLHNHYETDVRVRRKAEALVSAGYQVDLLALRSKYSPAKNYTLSGVNIYTISLGKKRGSLFRYFFEYLVFLFWSAFRVSTLMRKRRYAVVDVNNLPDFLVFAGIYPKWKGAKIVLDMHEITPEFYISKYGIKPNSWLVKLLTYIEQASVSFADYVININHPIEDVLVKRGMRASKSTIVMNSVDEEFFAASAASVPASVPQATSRPKFLMMYHGTATHIYGLDVAIEAFGKAHLDMPGAEFWIIGKGSQLSSLEALTRKLGLESKVKFVGLALPQEIPHWLSLCDIGVLPTRQDVFLDLSFSAKLSEYIVMRKAVIVSGLKTYRHYFSDQALAYFEPQNTTSLAEQMVSLFRSEDRRRRLADAALREYAPIRWEVMRQRYLKLMSDITGHRQEDVEASGRDAALASLLAYPK